MVAECQKRANKKWAEKNPERSKYISDRSRARNFLKKQILIEDLEEFKQLLIDREKELNNN